MEGPVEPSSYVRPEIVAMSAYAPGEQPQRGKTIKLNTNENPYPPSTKIAASIQAVLDRGLQKYPDPLASEFCQVAAGVLGVPADWILAGNGSDDILTITTRTLVGPGQVLRMPTPSYTLYKSLAEIQGSVIEEVPFNEDWSLSNEFGSSDNDPKLVFLPNPNSPTGTVVPPEAVLKLAQQLPCPLLVDEAYADFADFHCVDLVGLCDRIMVSRTLSKSYGLAGLRFGYLVAQPHLIEEFRKVKDSYNCDAISIAAATAAMSDQEWLLDNIAKIRTIRTRLTTALTELGFNVIPSHANFVWCRHPERHSQSIYEALKAAGILVRYMKYATWQDGLRISVGDDQQVNALLDQLKLLV
jgi:histidinol-phosphate aminotransferase